MGWLDSLGDLFSGIFSSGGGQAAGDVATEAAAPVAESAAQGGMGVGGDLAGNAMQYISPEADYFQSMYQMNPGEWTGGASGVQADVPYASATQSGMAPATAGTNGMLGGAYDSAKEGLGKAADWAGKNPNLVKLGLGAGMAGGSMLYNKLNQPSMPKFNMPQMSNQVAPLVPDYTPPPGTMASPLLRGNTPQVKDNSGLSKNSGGMAAF